MMVSAALVFLVKPTIANAASEDRLNTPRHFLGVELFLDDIMISNTRNIRRQIHPPQAHPENPIVRREHPWESLHVCLYGNVMFDESSQRFRMWYNAFGESYFKQQMLAYAESNDGVHWTKPMLDVIRLQEKKTNILMGLECNLHGPCVIRNPDPHDQQRRYLLLFDSYPNWREDAKELGIRGRWCYSAESPDGLHWSPAQGRPAFAGKADSGQSVVWEPQTQTFRAYTRQTTQDAFGQRIRIWRLHESKDFVHWSEPIELFRADEQDGYPDVQIQQLCVTRYDGIYIGLLSMFRIAKYEKTETAIDEGRQVNDIQLITSRDGIHFTRVADRQLFIPHADWGEFGTFGHRTAQLLVHGDRVFIYGDGRTVDSQHESAVPGMEIGVFTMLRDRFVSLSPARMREEALVELTPMVYTNDTLLLNAAVRGSGTIQAEIATFDGFSVIDGFSRSQSVEITGDSLKHELLWRHGNEIYSLDALPPEFQDKPVRLRLWISQADVFALRGQRSLPSSPTP